MRVQSEKQAAEAMTGLLRQNPTITAVTRATVISAHSEGTTGAWFGPPVRVDRQSGEDRSSHE
ncbi:hypothetical protein LAD64_23410 [Klebsiella pneumoniae]|nr:hypothetical protein [Klebsiella pneumoniae]